MKKNWLVCQILIILGLSSCVPEKDYYVDPSTKEVNTSEYSTEQTVNLNVHYSLADSKILFYVYDQNPLTFSDSGNSVTLDETIAPLDAAWTNDEGEYTGSITLPAYIKKAYIVTHAFNAPTLLEGTINNGTLNAPAVISSIVASRATRNYKSATKEDPERFNSLGWSTATIAGAFDRGDKKTVGTGRLYYGYDGNNEKLKLSKKERKSLLETVNSVIGRYKTCPEEYRTAADLYINDDDTEIVLTAIGGNTCWNSSLGYYYYKEGQKPASLNDVTIYALFPNTQLEWTSGAPNYFKAYPQGINIGDDVQLLYFDDKLYPEGTTKFPAGYRIGFVLACNAWDAYFTGYASYTKTKNFFASSTKGLSTPRPDGLDVRTAMFRDQNNNIAIAIEDFIDDQNYTDLIFCVKSNPLITNVPEVDENNNTTINKTGIYAFEDMWPQANDYDMNDVLAQYTYEKTFNNNNRIINESFIFKTFANKAMLNNGLAFTIENNASTTSSDFIKDQDTKDFIQTKFARENTTIILTNNVKSAMNTEYKVTFDYGKDSDKIQETVTNVFIYRTKENDMWLEIHCPMKKPTDKMDMSLFGTGDDRSEPDKGIFYVSDKNNVYPFAFYLSNATKEDIAPLLDPDNEKTSIDLLYPKFLNWAKTGKDADWYKK